MKKKVIIVGAGFSGLSLAYYLCQKNIKVEIYEKSNRCGGLIGTHKNTFGLAEQAANSFLATAKMEAFLQDLSIAVASPLPTAKKRFLFRGKPTPWPLQFFESLFFLMRIFFRFLPLLFFSKKTLRPLPEENLQDWGRRFFGRPATDFILSPAFQGIYASSAENLSASLLLGGFFNRSAQSRGKYRGLLSGKTGMGSVIENLQTYLQAKGVKIHFNQAMNKKDLFSLFDTDNNLQFENTIQPAMASKNNFAAKPPIIVVATSASQAISLLQEPVALELKKITMNSLTTATVFFKNTRRKEQGFGCLIPALANKKTKGILFNDCIFSERTKDDSVSSETWILDGSTVGFSKEELKNLILAERKEIFSVDEEGRLLDIEFFQWDQALPLYNTNLEQILQNLEGLQTQNLFLHGNYLGHLGLSKILQRSFDLAEKIEGL
ncbi:MAG: protoporphyrinogen oxidase [Pseudobdellovibrionaceae bacterium]